VSGVKIILSKSFLEIKFPIVFKKNNRLISPKKYVYTFLLIPVCNRPPLAMTINNMSRFRTRDMDSYSLICATPESRPPQTISKGIMPVMIRL
jgi:hypothetical protein